MMLGNVNYKHFGSYGSFVNVILLKYNTTIVSSLILSNNATSALILMNLSKFPSKKLGNTLDDDISTRISKLVKICVTMK